jgi:hypothetical protein
VNKLGMKTVPLEQLTVCHLVKKFPVFRTVLLRFVVLVVKMSVLAF